MLIRSEMLNNYDQQAKKSNGYVDSMQEQKAM